MNFLEDIILDAQRRGEFDNLKGKGRPLKTDESPVGGERRMAFSLVKEAGYTLAFIAERKTLLTRIDAARTELQTGVRQMAGTPWAEVHREKSIDTFRQEATRLNRIIRTYNLKAPREQFHLLPVDIEREINALEP